MFWVRESSTAAWVHMQREKQIALLRVTLVLQRSHRDWSNAKDKLSPIHGLLVGGFNPSEKY